MIKNPLNPLTKLFLISSSRGGFNPNSPLSSGSPGHRKQTVTEYSSWMIQLYYFTWIGWHLVIYTTAHDMASTAQQSTVLLYK